MRTFFAIDLPQASKQALADYMQVLRQHLEKHYKPKHFHWAKTENSHITLQFLGQVQEEKLPALFQKAALSLKTSPAFKLSLGPLEWFPSSYRPRVLSLQTQPQEILAELAEILGKQIITIGYPIEERPFRGHLSLARVENLENLDSALLHNLDLPPLPEVWVNEIVFFQSETQGGGPLYTRLAGFPLLP